MEPAPGITTRRDPVEPRTPLALLVLNILVALLAAGAVYVIGVQLVFALAGGNSLALFGDSSTANLDWSYFHGLLVPLKVVVVAIAAAPWVWMTAARSRRAARRTAVVALVVLLTWLLGDLTAL